MRKISKTKVTSRFPETVCIGLHRRLKTKIAVPTEITAFTAINCNGEGGI